MFYSIISLIIRIVLSLFLWQKGKFALSSRSRNRENVVELVSAAGILLGMWFGLFTLILLIQLGIGLWQDRKRGLRLSRELFLFLLTLLIFLKGPGQFSLDGLLGHI